MEFGALPCGYCASGFVGSAGEALLDRWQPLSEAARVRNLLSTVIFAARLLSPDDAGGEEHDEENRDRCLVFVRSDDTNHEHEHANPKRTPK